MDNSLDNTLIRVAGTWSSFGWAFHMIMNTYEWHKAIIVSDDEPGSCFYGASSIADELQSTSAVAANFSVTWIHLQAEATNTDIDLVLDQIRDHFRSTCFEFNIRRLIRIGKHRINPTSVNVSNCNVVMW
jgi:hypothetical protein